MKCQKPDCQGALRHGRALAVGLLTRSLLATRTNKIVRPSACMVRSLPRPREAEAPCLYCLPRATNKNFRPAAPRLTARDRRTTRYGQANSREFETSRASGGSVKRAEISEPASI